MGHHPRSGGRIRFAFDQATGVGTYVLTELGRETYEAATPGHVATVHRLVLDPLSAAQHRQLHAISRKIAGAIRPDGGWPGRC